MFHLVVPVALVAFVLAWLLKELPLRTGAPVSASVTEASPGAIQPPEKAARPAMPAPDTR